jgi:hypothetical protein
MSLCHAPFKVIEKCVSITILEAILVIVQTNLITLIVMNGVSRFYGQEVSLYEFADAITCCSFDEVLGLVFKENELQLRGCA